MLESYREKIPTVLELRVSMPSLLYRTSHFCDLLGMGHSTSWCSAYSSDVIQKSETQCFRIH